MREYNSFAEMSREDFRAFQLKSLEILLYFDSFCKEHALRYYLAGGTRIGALRNKGFIPWDEDIDVHMPRPDYERITKLWPRYADTKKFSFCRTDRKRNFHHHAASIMDNDTTYIMKRNLNEDIPQGILMDVIPLDGCPKGWIWQLIQLFWASVFAIYNVQRLPENQGGTLMRAATGLALTLVRKPSLRYRIWKKAEREMAKYEFDVSPYVKELVAPFKSMFIRYPGKGFTDCRYVEFEGRSFPVHRYYREYLKNGFGDYLKLPPEEKRVPKGIAAYINLDQGYRAFRGIHYCRGPEEVRTLPFVEDPNREG